jgi:hypothetical protein
LCPSGERGGVSDFADCGSNVEHAIAAALLAKGLEPPVLQARVRLTNRALGTQATTLADPTQRPIGWIEMMAKKVEAIGIV